MYVRWKEDGGGGGGWRATVEGWVRKRELEVENG